VKGDKRKNEVRKRIMIRRNKRIYIRENMNRRKGKRKKP